MLLNTTNDLLPGSDWILHHKKIHNFPNRSLFTKEKVPATFIAWIAK